jgi:hypothetical protein
MPGLKGTRHLYGVRRTAHSAVYRAQRDAAVRSVTNGAIEMRVGDGMTQNSEDRTTTRRVCKACGSRPAEGATVCEHCRTVLHLPDRSGLVEDEGAAVRRDFEGRDA